MRPRCIAVAVAATAFVVANVASTGNGSGVSPAQAQVLRRIRDALAWPPHAVYEEESVTTNTGRDGATHTVEYHEWLGTSRPYNSREVLIVNGKVLWEQAFVNGLRDLYDPTTDTIYLAPGVAPNGVVGCTRCSADTPQSNSALSEVQYLLNQPNVTIDRQRCAGRQACDRAHLRPRSLQLLDLAPHVPAASGRGPLLPGDHRFPIARLLTGSAASTNLVSLKAQHPHATVDHSPTDYKRAKLRLIGPVPPPPKIVCRQAGPQMRRCAPVPARHTSGENH